MKLDVTKWKAEISRIEKLIREQKSAQHESGQPRWEAKIGDKWPFGHYALRALKLKATDLYVVRAMLRGREHPAAKGWDDYQRENTKLTVLERYGLGREEEPMRSAVNP